MTNVVPAPPTDPGYGGSVSRTNHLPGTDLNFKGGQNARSFGIDRKLQSSCIHEFMAFWVSYQRYIVLQCANSLANVLSWYFSLGRHLDELHVTWAHLEKKRTRLQTNTKTLEDLCPQSLETATPSQLIK
ncbi:hypothetical protein Tco_0797214 [Tanacetum coccineum]